MVKRNKNFGDLPPNFFYEKIRLSNLLNRIKKLRFGIFQKIQKFVPVIRFNFCLVLNQWINWSIDLVECFSSVLQFFFRANKVDIVCLLIVDKQSLMRNRGDGNHEFIGCWHVYTITRVVDRIGQVPDVLPCFPRISVPGSWKATRSSCWFHCFFLQTFFIFFMTRAIKRIL